MSIYEQPRYTPVEMKAIENSPLDPLYPPEEKIPVITVSNFPALGQLIAMRFLEWVQDHPGGVVSLPTGKTPEHFIKWVNRLLKPGTSRRRSQLLEQQRGRPGTQTGHGEPAFRADRRVLSDPADAEEQFLPLREKVLHRRHGAGHREGLVDELQRDRYQAGSNGSI